MPPIRFPSATPGMSCCPDGTTAPRFTISTASGPSPVPVRSPASMCSTDSTPPPGVTFRAAGWLNVFCGYSEGSRAPTRHRTRLRRSGTAVQASQRDGRRSAARAGGYPDRRGGCARRTGTESEMELGVVPRGQSQRHSLRRVGTDRLRLLQELRQDAAAGTAAGPEQPDIAGQFGRRVHVSRCDLPESGRGWRGGQQHQ